MSISFNNDDDATDPDLEDEAYPDDYPRLPLSGAPMTFILGLPPAAPKRWGESVTLQGNPQRVVAVDTLVVESRTARFYVIEQVTVGGEAQFTSDNPVPAEMFAAGSFGVRFETPATPPGVTITLRARAVKPPAPRVFAIAWWVRWFTREGWAARTPRRPPPLNALFKCRAAP